MKKLACGLALVLGLPALAGAYVELPDLPEPQQRTIENDDILNAYLRGEYAYGWRLLQDRALQEIRQRLNDEKLIPSLVVKAAGKLAQELNDPSKTEREKGVAVLKEIEYAMEPYESAPAGALDLSFRHSIEYGATRLSWNHQARVDECRGAYCGWRAVCTDRPGGGYDCSGKEWHCDVWVDYVLREPDYHVYRIVNGQEKLLSKITGRRVVRRQSIQFGSNWKDLLSVLKVDWDFEMPLPEGRAFFTDLNADYRNVGDTLSYRVVSDNGPYQLGECGNSQRRTTTAWADQDGDGRMDFIPGSAYDNFVGIPGALSVPRFARPGETYRVSWLESSGTVTRYELQQAATAAFTNAVDVPGGPGAEATLVQPSGVYHYRVRACNDAGCSAWRAAARPIHVTSPPTAQASAAAQVNAKASVALQGSGSDAEGPIASYRWTQTAGPSATISNPRAASTTFTAPAVTADVSVTFELVVTDADGATGRASVTIVVRAPIPIPNVRPLYNVCSVYNTSQCNLSTNPPGPYTVGGILGYILNGAAPGTVPLYNVCSVYNSSQCTVQSTPGGIYTRSDLIGHVFTASRPHTVPIYRACSVYNQSQCTVQATHGGPYMITTLLGYLYTSNTLPAI